MKRLMAGLLTTAGLLTLAAPVSAHTAHPLGTVIIRSGPGTEYGVLGTLSEGQTAQVLSHENDWLKIRTASGAVGYMADWVTRQVFDDETIYVQVDTDVLNVRSQPSLDAALLGQVTQGQRYRLLEGLGDWYKIDAGRLGTGWVSAEFVFQASAPPASQPPLQPPPDTAPVEGQIRQGLVKAVGAALATTMHIGRDKSYDRVAYVRAGELLTYVGSAEGWLKVTNQNGQTGWINGTEAYLWDQNLPFARQAQYGVKEHDWRLRYLRVREVVPNGTGLVLRDGPSWTASVKKSLTAGDQLKLLTVPDGEYVEVMLANGEVGWLSRNWIKPVDGMPTESVRLYQVAPGHVRLELTGQAAKAAVVAEGKYLRLTLAENANRLAGLAIGQHGIGEMTLDRNSLTLSFEQPFHHKVVEQTESRTVVEFRNEVKRVEALAGADRQTFRFHLEGQVLPVARREGGAVTLTLAGALLGGGAVPEGVVLAQTAAGVTARVQTDRPFAIKRGAGFVDLVIYQPGLQGKTIVLDPGHGGSEIGAVGPTGLKEQDANLAIALKLRTWLQAAGANVIMTRTGDTRCASPAELATVPFAEQLRYDLNCRTVIANTKSADAFVSVHGNANPSRAEQGTETYWSSLNLNAGQSQLLATFVQQEMVKLGATRDRGVKDERFYVVRYTDAPAVLAEVAFVSNPWEEGLLKSDAFQARVAESMLRALERYFR